MSTLSRRTFATVKILAYVVCGGVASCHMPGLHGNGKIVTNSREVTEFSAIEAGGVFEIEWAPGPQTVSITTDENLIGHIRTKVAGKTLQIEWDTQLRPTKGIKVKLSGATLTGAELNGAVRFSASGFTGGELFIEGNGATRILLHGAVRSLTAGLNGASRLDAETLQTQACEMSIQGAGRAEVNVTESLKVAISGAGKVVYGGNPKSVEKSVSGAGSIHPRG